MSSWNPTTEGTIPFAVGDETYETWYRVFGELGKGGRTPLIVLHGGPGLSHDYLLPISDLSSSRPVVFYDQLGNARSTHLRDKPRSFWTVDLFIDELENVIRHCGCEDDFDLIGHSWGGILALEFELRRKPAGLRHLILTNSLPSMALWNQSNAQLLRAFPQDIQDAMAVGMKDLKVSAPAMKKFREVHGCRIHPFPTEYVYTLDQLFSENADPTVAVAMFSSEIKEWDVIDKLHLVRLPVLVINGHYDVSQDFVNLPFFKNVQKVKWVTLSDSSHTPMWEEREKYMQLITDFLDI